MVLLTSFNFFLVNLNKSSTRVALLSLIGFVFSCCSTYRPTPYLPSGSYTKQISADVWDPQMLQKYNAMPQSTPEDIQRKVARRNQVLQELMWLVDQNYGSFEGRYYGSDASVNFGGDVAILGLTGVGAVTGSAHLKSILSAIAEGTTGIKTSYEKNFYDQQTRAAIVQKMRASRATEVALIEDQNHMKASVVQSAVGTVNGTETAVAYSLEQGLSDIDDYYNAGTIIGALQAITESAGRDQDAARQQRKANSQQRQLF